MRLAMMNRADCGGYLGMRGTGAMSRCAGRMLGARFGPRGHETKIGYGYRLAAARSPETQAASPSRDLPSPSPSTQQGLLSTGSGRDRVADSSLSLMGRSHLGAKAIANRRL